MCVENGNHLEIHPLLSYTCSEKVATFFLFFLMYFYFFLYFSKVFTHVAKIQFEKPILLHKPVDYLSNSQQRHFLPTDYSWFPPNLCAHVLLL